MLFVVWSAFDIPVSVTTTAVVGLLDATGWEDARRQAERKWGEMPVDLVPFSPGDSPDVLREWNGPINTGEVIVAPGETADEEANKEKGEIYHRLDAYRQLVGRWLPSAWAVNRGIAA